MKIITVSGANNTGKTTLIKMVYQHLMNNGGELIYYEARGARLDDFHAVVVWRGKIIALCSVGDSPKYIKAGIAPAEAHHAEILINARTKGIQDPEYKACLGNKFGTADYDQIELEDPNPVENLIKNKQLAFDEIIEKLISIIEGIKS